MAEPGRASSMHSSYDRVTEQPAFQPAAGAKSLGAGGCTKARRPRTVTADREQTTPVTVPIRREAPAKADSGLLSEPPGSRGSGLLACSRDVV